MSVPSDSAKKKTRRKGKKGRKYGRKRGRNGRPFHVNGGCGCEFCRASGLNR